MLSYSCGLGLKGITSTFRKKRQISEEAEVVKKESASHLDNEVERVTEITKTRRSHYCGYIVYHKFWPQIPKFLVTTICP